MNALITKIKEKWYWCVRKIRNKPMLESIEFTFSMPICHCPKKNISWGLDYESFFIICETCNTKLLMDYSKLQAKIIFIKPYPEGDINKESNIRVIK